MRLAKLPSVSTIGLLTLNFQLSKSVFKVLSSSFLKFDFKIAFFRPDLKFE